MEAVSFKPNIVGHLLAVSNTFFNYVRANPTFGPTFGTWFVQSCSNMLKLVYPSRAYIAT